MTMKTIPVVMAIAGFDPSAGAGVLADIKTISAFGCYGLGVATSLTMQNTREVVGALHQTGETISRQLEPLFEDFEIAAVKTGMLPTAEAVETVVSALRANQVPHIVVDPVTRSTSRSELIDGKALDASIRMLFPLASLVTPNWEEAGRITGITVRDERSAEQVARLILSHGPRAVLLKGGDVDAESATDLLVDPDGTVAYRVSKIDSRNTHGTGCTFSSAVACMLARGATLRDAIAIAKNYVRQAILTAPGIGHGNGPLNHFPPDWGV